MDSMPKMESKKKRLKALKGMVPSLLNMGEGCKLFSADLNHLNVHVEVQKSLNYMK